MGDIDFDELDRAVNSLMSGKSVNSKAVSAQETNSTPSAQPAQRVSIPSRRATMPTVAPKQADSLALKSATKPAAAPGSAGVRRAGRFMDVVDSTADLNPMKRPLPVTPVRPVPSLPKPTSPQVEESVSSISSKPPVVQEKIQDSPSEPVMVRRITKNDTMPDPLDTMKQAEPAVAATDVPAVNVSDDERPAAAFRGLSQQEKTPVATASAPSENTKLGTSLSDLSQAIQAQLGGALPADKPGSDEPSQPVVPTSDTTAPQDPTPAGASATENADATPTSADPTATDAQRGESPFLANARPEKRPLNAPQSADSEETQIMNPAVVSDNVANDVAGQSTPKDAETPGGATMHDDIHELSHELVKIEATGRMTDDEVVHPTGGQTPLGATTALATSTSISQQYVQKESTGDTSHAPIYDTAEYEKTLKHPAKKQSGWWIVLGVLVLLALGSGGAVALYFMGLIP